MGKKKATEPENGPPSAPVPPAAGPVNPTSALRLPAEILYADELAFLRANDKHPRPPGWHMSPQLVHTYVVGGTVAGKAITAKYLGDARVVEIAIATLTTDRALLLIGEPGTAKSWL